MDAGNKLAGFTLTKVAETVALTIALGFSTVVLAETTNNVDRTETIQVLGESYRNTATKTSLDTQETPQAITVIDDQQLEQRGVKSLNQALRYAPGVVTETKGGAVTMYDTFSIRGFASEQSYYDGLLLQSLNGWNLQPQIDPIAMQQVEVFKGPTSVLYGSMPPGGMVNMIAKSPQKEANTEFNIATGSRNLRQGSIDSTGQIGNSNLNYRFIALAKEQDGQVDGTKEKRFVVAPSLDWQVTDNTLINFNLYYQNDPEMGMNSSLPASGMIYSNANGSTSPSTFAGDTNWSSFEREVLMVGYKIDHSFNDSWSFLQNTRYTDSSLSQKNTYHLASNFDETTGDLARNIYSTEEESKAFVIDNQLSGFVYTADVEHNVLFGIDYQQLKGDSVYKEFSTTDSAFNDFNIFNPNNAALNRENMTETYEGKDGIKVKQLGLYFQDQMRWDNVVVIAGGRYDFYKSTSNYNDASGSSESEADHGQFSYRVGALYEFDNGIAPFASFATSFEPATGLDGNGNGFNPEIGQQVEVGIKHETADRRFNSSASLFHITKTDALMYNPADPWGAQLQMGEIVSQGVELQSQMYLTESWDITASYTFIDMEITEGTVDLEGTTPIYVPKHSANIWSNYNFYGGVLNGTRLSAGVRYVGEMQMDAANSEMVPDYTLFDLSIGYDLGAASQSLKGASVNLSANNLFDKEYYSCFDTANCWYGEERTVEFNVNYKF